jgi:hypothetical protein
MLLDSSSSSACSQLINLIDESGEMIAGEGIVLEFEDAEAGCRYRWRVLQVRRGSRGRGGRKGREGRLFGWDRVLF